MRFRRSNSDQTIDVCAIFRWAIRAAFAIALLWHPAVAGTPNEIGNVNNVRHIAYGTMPAQPRAVLRPGEQVVSNEILETATDAALHIKFIDNSDFHLGSASRATLDKFLYDPLSQDGQMALLLKEGIFRFKTGQMKASGIQVVTAVAIITPKGTEFIVQVLASGDIIVSVISGAVEITPLAQASGPATISAPDTARVFGNGVIHGGVDPPVPDEGIELHVMLAALETEEPLVTDPGQEGEPVVIEVYVDSNGETEIVCPTTACNAKCRDIEGMQVLLQDTFYRIGSNCSITITDGSLLQEAIETILAFVGEELPGAPGPDQTTIETQTQFLDDTTSNPNQNTPSVASPVAPGSL